MINPSPNPKSKIQNPKSVGRLVKSNSHTDYVAQVYRRWEVPSAPTPADHAFGTFVCIPVTAADELVGIVYDTQLLNPEFGAIGPRLASPTEVEVFAPDYLDEKAMLVGIFIAGERTRQSDGTWLPSHDVPPLAADVDAEVISLSDEEVRAFHAEPGGPRLAYFPRLLAQRTPVSPSLMLSILDRLAQLFPADLARLAVLRRNIAWQTSVGTTR
jgi:hypothetical protein